MSLEYKSIPFAIKTIDPGPTGWEIEGLASTFWGTPDSYGDVVAPGAFSESIATRSTKFLYEHYEPIGKQLEIRETEQGLYGRWSIVATRAGEDAHKLAVAGVLDSLSIGYIPLEWETRADGVRVLQKIDLLEVSCVALPANPNAVITGVKRRAIPDPPPEPEPAPEPEPDVDAVDVRGAAPPAPTLAEILDLASMRARLVALGVDLQEAPS